MDERRRHIRFKKELMVTTVYRDEQNMMVTEDSIVSEDIGIGGLRIAFPRRLKKGKILDLKVFLFPDPIHLPAKGRVAWSREKEAFELSARNSHDETKKDLYWAGVQFIDIDDFHRERILRWIKKEFSVEEL